MSSQPEIKIITCPNCLSRNIRKFGTKKNKLETFQKYQCKACGKTFTPRTQIKGKTYPINIILAALSLYNLGHTQTEIITILSKKHKLKPSQKTISNWLNEYKPLTPYHKLRFQATKLYPPEETIEKHQFLHNNLPYTYQLHRAKLDLLFKTKLYNNPYTTHKKFQKPLTEYLNKIPTKGFPHKIFKPKKEKLQQLSRSSQLRFQINKFIKESKNNLANKLTALALNLAKTNRQRHQAVQNFFLINDSTTIAAEIPIYLTRHDINYFKKRNFNLNLGNYQTPITGHIDLLQIRNNLIHILDYKPLANRQNPINQLTIYALALASRTKLPLTNFKAAWFDENNYYEFYPLHAVYKKRN